MEELVTTVLTNQRMANVNSKELIDSYWAMIDECVDVGYETKENTRGQKRKLPATEQMKKINKIVDVHTGNRTRMVADSVARSSTDH